MSEDGFARPGVWKVGRAETDEKTIRLPGADLTRGDKKIIRSQTGHSTTSLPKKEVLVPRPCHPNTWEAALQNACHPENCSSPCASSLIGCDCDIGLLDKHVAIHVALVSWLLCFPLCLLYVYLCWGTAYLAAEGRVSTRMSLG